MRTPDPDLYVFLHAALVGCAVRGRRGAIHFSYLDNYPMSAPPVSLSLPNSRRRRLDISSWIDGLLPDNPRTRSRWMRELGAATVEPFDLLSTRAGLECAGAVQFCTEPVLPLPRLGTLLRLTEAETAAALRMISQDADGAFSEGMGELRLSLPGAQPKLALRLSHDEWCLPTGTLASTHILKPQRGHLNPAVRDSIAVNEHLCQAVAASLGMDAARTSLARFEDVTCLVTERFDRRRSDEEIRRVHFEDVCQSMGYSPALRYQADGGPSPEAIIEFLRRETGHDGPRAFFLSACYNWLIGNTDGHSKNYGLFLDAPAPRLAPLYDVSSAVPYLSADVPPSRLAMQFDGGSPGTLKQWEQAAVRLRVDVGDGECEAMARNLPEAFAAAAEMCPDWTRATAGQIAEKVTDHARIAAR